VEKVRGDGYTHALLLGMGGSSLAPEVFRKTFGVKDGYLDLAVLDSTDPGAVLAHAERLDPEKTLFIVSTKSGGTVETLSFFKFFYNWTASALGTDKAGDHFIAITDPGSSLADVAATYNFRTTFLNDPNIGGRYSALSYFGLVPAALVGIDLGILLGRAMTAACNCESCNCPVDGNNIGGRLGAIMGELARTGRDKVTFLTSAEISSFGDWVEQLIAESTGKEGKGILPVVGEAAGAPEVYGNDRLFAYLRLGDDETHDSAARALEEAGHPVVWIRLDDLYDLGSQFFIWEMATAVAGSRLGINPFDQPNVEAAKVIARKMVAAYQEEGTLPELVPILESGDISVYGDSAAESISDALKKFLALANPGKNDALGRSYIAIQAYIRPTPEADNAIHELRTKLRARYAMAVTTGYGPRFLHSTGQLHKGDAGNGLFIQLTSDMPEDAPVPDEAGSDGSSITFGVLKNAQALGDRQALLDAGRDVIRFHLGKDVPGALRQLIEHLERIQLK
jgi:glucose-6-phosphate isomerase